MRTYSKWTVLFVVMMGTFIAALNTSIVNVSMPSLIRVFNSDIYQVEWVITAYMIAFATAMPIMGWLKERLSYRNLFMIGLGIFTFGSLLCGISASIEFLIFSRVIQAIGGGLLSPTAMAIIADIFPEKERGRALGFWGLGTVIGPAIGPTLGGFISESFSWKGIFLINIPMGIITMWFGWYVLDRTRLEIIHKIKFDFLGFLAITTSVVSFLYALTILKDGILNYEITSLILLSIFMAWFFIWQEKRAAQPLWDLQLFRNRSFVVCILVSLSRSAALFGGVFLLPFLLQQQLGYSETTSGMILFPGSIFLGVLMPVIGGISDRHGVRLLSITGLVIVAVSMFLFADVSTSSSALSLTMILIVRGIGLAFLVTPLSAATMNAVKPHQFATASSISGLAQQFGGTIGIASLVLLKSFIFQLRMNEGVPEAMAELQALHFTFACAGFLVLIAIIPAWWLPEKSLESASKLTPAQGS